MEIWRVKCWTHEPGHRKKDGRMGRKKEERARERERETGREREGGRKIA